VCSSKRVELDPALLLAICRAQFLLHGVLGSLRQVGGLDIFLYAHQRLLQGVEGARVQHLLLDLGGVGAPGHEEQLLLLGALRGALALVHVLKVKQAISAFSCASLLQVLEELVILGVSLADHLHVYLLLVADVEHHVAVLLILLDLLVRSLADVRYCYPGSHFKTRIL